MSNDYQKTRKIKARVNLPSLTSSNGRFSYNPGVFISRVFDYNLDLLKSHASFGSREKRANVGHHPTVPEVSGNNHSLNLEHSFCSPSLHQGGLA